METNTNYLKEKRKCTGGYWCQIHGPTCPDRSLTPEPRMRISVNLSDVSEEERKEMVDRLLKEYFGDNND